MQAVLLQIITLDGRQDAGRNNMMLMCFPVGIAKDRGSFGGLCLYLCRKGKFWERIQDVGNQKKKLVVGALSRWMDTHLSCVIYSCVSAVTRKDLIPKRQGRGCACRISKMQQGMEVGRMLCSNFDQQWPFKAEQGMQRGRCPVQTPEPRELYSGGQCQAGTAKTSWWQRESD